jgi:hypothetical protein
MLKLLFLLSALSLLAGDTKKAPAPAKVLWTYETPRGFQLLEPSYRYPTQIKEALLRYVQPVPALAREYHEVFRDKHKLATWLKGVLSGEKVRRAQAAKDQPTVLSSDPSQMSVGNATITSTAKRAPKPPAEADAIDRYLDVLKVWDGE